jgi:leader peptidase (prepilin peptidase)/N-methyltransferase
MTAVAVPAVALVGVLGLVIGSFLNVVIARVPAGASVVRPPSRCPCCEHVIRPRHNVPVASWLVLRGRCADCASPISPRYPLVELAAAVLFVFVALALARLDLLAALPAFLYLAAAGLALAVIDIDTKRLPDRIVLPSYPLLAVLLAAASAGTGDWWSLARAALGAVAVFGGYFAVALAYPGGMGFGDVKLAGLLGGALGYLSWSAVAVGVLAGLVLGAVVGGVRSAVRRGGGRIVLPFGPFLVAGALLALVVTSPLATWYAHLSGIG